MKEKSYLARRNLLFIAAILIAATIYAGFVPKDSIRFELSGDSLSVVYGSSTIFSETVTDQMVIPLRKIRSIASAPLPQDAELIDGLTTEQYRVGLYQTAEYGACELFVHNEIGTCVVIQTTDSEYYLFNIENAEVTEEFISSFRTYLEDLGYTVDFSASSAFMHCFNSAACAAADQSASFGSWPYSA